MPVYCRVPFACWWLPPLFLPVVAHDPVHVGPDSQQLPHFVTGLFAAGVGRLSLRQQSGVLGLEVLDGGQLFQSQAVKEIFRLMQQYVTLMFSAEFFESINNVTSCFLYAIL